MDVYWNFYGGFNFILEEGNFNMLLELRSIELEGKVL